MHSLDASRPARTSSSEKRKWKGPLISLIKMLGSYTHTHGHSLKKLKEKLSAQRKHLDELDQHIKELESERGGEQ